MSAVRSPVVTLKFKPYEETSSVEQEETGSGTDQLKPNPWNANDDDGQLYFS